MVPIKEKRVRLSIDEKLLILNHRKEKPKITKNKIENKRLRKLWYEMDHMYFEENFETEAEHWDLIIAGGNDAEEIQSPNTIFQ